MVDVRFTIKEWFFDRARVQRAVDRAVKSALSRVGAFIRRRAKSSIRKRRRISMPGHPPSSHVGLLKKYILFGYEPRRKTVVVGAVDFSGRGVPRTLERGGPVRFAGGLRANKRAIMKPRPYIGPAAQAEVRAGTIPRSFRIGP